MALSIDEYREWETKIDVSLQIHEKHVRRNLKVYREYYNGRQWEEDPDSTNDMYNDKIVDNMVFQVVSTIKPAINMNKPKVFVTPKKRQFVVNGKTMDASSSAIRVQILSDYLLNELRIRDTVDMNVADALIGHRGFAFIGYEVKLDESPLEDGFLQMLDSESLFVDRVSEMDLIYDTESKNHNFVDAEWIGIRWVEKLDDLKKDKSLTNTKDLAPNGVMENAESVDSGAGMGGMVFKRMSNSENLHDQSTFDRVEGWDIWDKKNQRLYKIVPGHRAELSDKSWPIDYKTPYGNGFPIETLWFNFNPDTNVPLADTKVYITKQRFLNRFWSKLLDHIRTFADLKWGYDSSKQKIHQRIVNWARGASHSVIGGKGDPATWLKPFQIGTASPDLFRIIPLLKADILSSLGVAQYEVGGAEQFATAKEGSLVQGGVSNKRFDRSATIERFFADIMTKVHKVAQQVLPDGTEVPLSEAQMDLAEEFSPQQVASSLSATPEGDIKREAFPFMSLDRDLIGGAFSFDIEVGSTRPTDDALEADRASALNRIANSNPFIRTREATKIILEKIGLQSFVDRLLKSPEEVSQEAEQSAQQTMETLLAEPKLKTSTDLKKTQMKTEAQLESARIKSRSEGALKAVDSLSAESRNETDVIKAMIQKRDRDRRKDS